MLLVFVHHLCTRGTNTIGRNKREFSDIGSTPSDVEHPVNRTALLFFLFALRGFFPLLSVVSSARPLLQELVERHVTNKVLTITNTELMLDSVHGTHPMPQ